MSDETKNERIKSTLSVNSIWILKRIRNTQKYLYLILLC